MSALSYSKLVFITVMSQFIIVSIIAIFCYSTKDNVAGLSVIWGGIVYCVPYLFAGVYLHNSRGLTAGGVVLKAQIAYVAKLLISIFMFVYVFKYLTVDYAVFFMAYIGSLLIQYTMSFVLCKRY